MTVASGSIADAITALEARNTDAVFSPRYGWLFTDDIASDPELAAEVLHLLGAPSRS